MNIHSIIEKAAKSKTMTSALSIAATIIGNDQAQKIAVDSMLATRDIIDNINGKLTDPEIEISQIYAIALQSRIMKQLNVQNHEYQ